MRRLKLPHSLVERVVKQILVHRRRGHIKPFPEQGDLIVFDALFENWPVWHDNAGLGGTGLGLQLQQLLAQELKLRMTRLEAPQIRCGIRSKSN